MGYEVKLYAVRKFKGTPEHTHTISTLDLGKIGYTTETQAFLDEFHYSAPFSIFVNNEWVRMDQYGAEISYGDTEYLLELAQELAKEDDWWLNRVLVKWLEAFVEEDDIYICLYGY